MKKEEKRPKIEVLVNKSFEETRAAILEDNRLVELIWERRGDMNIVGNIYKATVENVLPGISSAFVNIGYEKNAYLYISDVLNPHKKPIDTILKKGQKVVVQVVKDAIGTKGMKITMDIALPGRFLVLTPYQKFIGVSKNIEDHEIRQALNETVKELAEKYLDGMGCIVRTEAEESGKDELEKEVKYLARQWKTIMSKFDKAKSPTLLHEDMKATMQISRDILSEDVKVYLLDNKDDHDKVMDFVSRISPELKDKVKFYKSKTPIFEAFGVEEEIDNLRKTTLPLPSGGSIVIQEAESLCAIDVNTGKFTGSKSQEETVTQTNIEAAEEVAHQLRLRNIGGIIVIDFIDMKKAYNRHKVVDALNDAVRYDRAKIRILPITRLGLVEMTRERKRESTSSLLTQECGQCGGSGRLLSSESIRIKIQREIHDLTQGKTGGNLRIVLHPILCELLKRKQQVMENNVNRKMKIQADAQIPWEEYKIILE